MKASTMLRLPSRSALLLYTIAPVALAASAARAVPPGFRRRPIPHQAARCFTMKQHHADEPANGDDDNGPTPPMLPNDGRAAAAGAAASQQPTTRSTPRRPAGRERVGLPKAVRHAGLRPDTEFLRPTSLASHEIFGTESGGDKPFTVLGIETSCDDTGVAIVASDGTILGEALASQAALHEEWGGVVPGLARDAHIDALDRVVAEALERANMSSVADVDAVGVTVGPGLEICLRVGTERAKELANAHSKPFVGVHHLEAHVLMSRLAAAEAAGVAFPFLTLLTSGGHCQLMLTKGVGEHVVLGSTLDDALGEAFDKVARLLELPIGGGGGPALERLAAEGQRGSVALPIPMRSKKNLDFSFAGLKTAVRLAVERADDETRASPSFHADVAASFQDAAFSHLEQRLRYAFTYCDSLYEDAARGGVDAAVGVGAVPPSTLVVSGGVAANMELRRRLQELCEQTPAPEGARDASWQLVVPPPRLCTDNGVMVAWAAVEALKLGIAHEAEGQEVKARWPLGRLAEGVDEHIRGGTRSKQKWRKGVVNK